ncbi:MAG: ATP-dependent RecD-like DNA helicase [Proteobacteria bacterium]|nr:ATP-dependent RecD-like DNA helicase [Pseudomonadota bacterium]
MITLKGHLTHITYTNEDNYYTIARFSTLNPETTITVVGFLAGINPHEPLKIQGQWETHAKYGQQFKIDSFETILPTTTSEITRYLKSLGIKGLTRKKIKHIVNRFEENTFETIEKEPEKLKSVSGIGDILANRLHDTWKDHHATRSLMNFFKEKNFPVSLVAPVIKAYGKSALHVIEKNPYQLLADIFDLDFHLIDNLANQIGVPRDDQRRISACIHFTLEAGASDGHVYMALEALVKRCASFGIPHEKVKIAIKDLIDLGVLAAECLNDEKPETAVYPKALYNAEKGIAARLSALLSMPVTNRGMDRDKIVDEIVTRLAINPSKEQLEVLEDILYHRAVIITGGPGTGKTTLIRSILSIFNLIGKRVLLAAPTGRAARRLSEVTGRKASTIHKLIGFNHKEGQFEKNRDTPLDTDILIIDEASMVDTILMYHLFNALPFSASIIIVGDIFQLPSVGPGNVLSDMIQSNKIKTFSLKKIFRQAKESPIIINAHAVRQGQFPDLKKQSNSKKLSEFYFIETASPPKVVERIVELCCQRIPKSYGLDPMKDIQVLTPMHKGDVGTIHLNQILQDAMNPEKTHFDYSGRKFKPGDKVMHLKNNYEKEVFNGDIGTIHALDKSENRLTVNYEDRLVDYHLEELHELTLAYAISVHKSQGSEYPAVIIPLMEQHFPLLQRNLLYTAITRGKKLVILIGTSRAFAIALNNDKQRKRNSALDIRLINLMGPLPPVDLKHTDLVF